MPLADKVAKLKAQELVEAARRADPELEARLYRFIAENPRLRDHYNAMSKEEDRQANELALVEGNRLLSSYTGVLGVKIWIITKADRSATTVLLPEDY